MIYMSNNGMLFVLLAIFEFGSANVLPFIYLVGVCKVLKNFKYVFNFWSQELSPPMFPLMLILCPYYDFNHF
jgi:hypothetical protein